MQGKFIYVFERNARDKLLAEGYKLIKSDERQNVFVFENRETHTFSEDFAFVFSDTLTF